MSRMFTLNIDFMGYRRMANAFSLFLILLAIAFIGINGLRFGLDFTGGTLIELQYEQAPDLGQLRNALETAGYEHFVVQNFGSTNDVLVRLNAGFSNEAAEEIRRLLSLEANPANLKQAAFVGAQVGAELRDKGGMGVLVALFGILLYIAFRFQMKFGIGAVVGLAFDILLLIGFIAMAKVDVDLTVLAALMAAVGYSLNDTIVVYDRIRENFRLQRDMTPEEIINTSVNQTLIRTTITSFSTLLAVFALFFMGGEMIRNFALIMIVSIIIGTFSSIYVASTLLLNLKIRREDLAVPVKEGVLEDDGRP